METETKGNYLSRIEELENRLAEAEQLIEAIKAGEVDAFALNKNNKPEVFTLHSGDYAYRVLVENFSEGALNLSEDGLIVYTNASFYEMLGLTYEKVIGKNIFQFIHPDSREIFRDLFRKGLAGQSKSEINLVAVKKAYPVYVSLTSLYPTMQSVGMIVTDLSDKKEQEKILKQSEEKFNKIFAASPLALTLTEIQSGKMVDANDIYFETIGYSRQECLGKTSLELNLVNRDTREKLLAFIFQNGSLKNAETEITARDGKQIPVLLSTEKINIGNKEYLLSAIIDITERKITEQMLLEKNTDLQKMNKELEAFTYISSHDLQEPLRKLQTFAGRIIEKESLSETGKDYFKRMQDAAARMQALIQDLLNFSRLAISERKFEFTDLTLMAEEVIAEFKEIIESKNAVIEVIGSGNASIIPFQFRQLMRNLINNALKFSKKDVPPYISIKYNIIMGSASGNEKLLPEKEYYHISVSDNGIGFESQFADKIFEVFQKLHGKDQYPGTGIGLAIVNKIVENHNGIITASGEPGKGARFDIFLPV